jgi:ABC-type amino acid transport substrate-binding protein
MRAASTLALMLSLTLLAAAPAMAVNSGELTGSVTAQDGSPASGMTVCVQKKPGECAAKAATNEDGRFRIAQTAPGWEFVSVAGDDHLCGQWVWVAPDSSQNLQLKLQPKPRE